MLRSKGVASLLTGGGGGGAEPLSIITTLRKLCNHPELLRSPPTSVNDGPAVGAAAGVAAETGTAVAGEGFQHLFPGDYQPCASQYSGWILEPQKPDLRALIAILQSSAVSPILDSQLCEPTKASSLWATLGKYSCKERDDPRLDFSFHSN